MESTTEIRVRNYHIDHFGHVNHARYLELLEEARWHYLEANALLEPIHRIGAYHVVAKIVIEYLHGARIGDLLCIDTRIDSCSKYRFVFRQRGVLKDSGKVSVLAYITNAFVDAKGRSQEIDGDILDMWPDLSNSFMVT